MAEGTRTSRMTIEKNDRSLEANFLGGILRDSIKLHAEFFMMPASTRSEALREKNINDIALSKMLLFSRAY